MVPASSLSPSRLPPELQCDFVSTDHADLASHMSGCARSQGRFFGVGTALQVAHSVVASRIVTVAICAVAGIAVVTLF